MQYFIFLILLSLSLFAHSTLDLSSEQKEGINYGVYSDIKYRDKDLYPRGIEGSLGYENHGTTKKAQFNHLGLYLFGDYEKNFIYGVEFNKHIDAEDSFDSYLEKAYVGYKTHHNNTLKLGRDYNNISFVNNKPYGYGFADMPLAIDSFLDGTYLGDGIFLEYANTDNMKSYLDVTQDKYNKNNRSTLKLEYNLKDTQLIAYLQYRKTAQLRFDYSATTHTHSHGNQNGCTNLSSLNERCFERDNKLLGLGFNHKIGVFDLQGEYLYLDSKGDVYNNQYKVENHNKINTLYLQGLTNYQKILLGYRSEWFMFDNHYNGGGATEITAPLVSQNANKIQNLQTLMLGYKFNKNNKTSIELKQSQDDWAFGLNYNLFFGN
ncbi:MAG: Unknown protein [uncultured Sulfurovum sp.]|uniref:Uncharacterized protein n=1 Tax=uncultured Sulfurovum sp. TaxID=269237 RepID=A0A6S6T241_9BACT|nr:MAG: Unknown protein [uncultured Sulfurovum sp.]